MYNTTATRKYLARPMRNTMCSYYTLKFILIRFFLILSVISLEEYFVQGGHCWNLVGKNGRCQQLLQAYVTKDECCRDGGATIAWSADDLNSSRLFFWRALGGGAPNCQPCRETCENVRCAQGKKCVLKKNKPKCVCAPDCSKLKHSGPVCGTDGKTYKNACNLTKHKCRQRNVDIGYYSRCQASCNKVTCPQGRHCVVDQNKQPHCVQCIQYCRGASSPEDYVCGTDGVTYENLCELRKAACLLGKAIPLAYSWKCEGSLTCENLRCNDDKVCLLNKGTNRPQCTSCTNFCHSNGTTLCGSDNNTYSNWCQMRAAACQSGYVIETKHSGHCGVEPTAEPEYMEISEGDTEEEMFDDENLSLNHVAPPSMRFKTS